MHIDADRTHIKAADGAVVQAPPSKKMAKSPIAGIIKV
jgi:hypothetical protein